MVLKPHFCGIFYLGRASSHKLVGGCRSHRTGNSHLSLTSYLSPGNGCVLFHYISDQSGGGKRADNPLVAVSVYLLQVVQHSWQNSARTACRGSDYGASAGILFTYCKGVGKYEPPCPEHILISFGPDEIVGRLSPHVQRSRKSPFLVYSALYRSLHGIPYFRQIIPYLAVLDAVYIFPVGPSVVVAPFQKFRHGVQGIDVRTFRVGQVVAYDSSSSNTVECPFVLSFSIRPFDGYLHCIRMPWQEDFRLPFDFYAACLGQDFVDGHVSKMPLACSRKRPVQGDFESSCVGMLCEICFCSPVRPHSMAA